MYWVPPKTVDTSQYPLSFICSHINLLSDAWHCQTRSYLTVSTLDPSPSTSHSIHTFIYFRSLLKCHFLRRPFLTTLFKFKILPYALLALLLPLLLALLLSGTLCCGCSPFTLRVPLPTFVPFSVPWEAVLHGLHPLGSFALWIPFEFCQWEAPAGTGGWGERRGIYPLSIYPCRATDWKMAAFH